LLGLWASLPVLAGLGLTVAPEPAPELAPKPDPIALYPWPCMLPSMA
jgi:hypothetical protein